MLYETEATPRALNRRRSAVRKARVALAAALVAMGLVLPPLLAGPEAPPLLALFTGVRGRTILGSRHSPGPTPVDVPG
jgi:hypothetical protein